MTFSFLWGANTNSSTHISAHRIYGGMAIHFFSIQPINNYSVYSLAGYHHLLSRFACILSRYVEAAKEWQRQCWWNGGVKNSRDGGGSLHTRWSDDTVINQWWGRIRSVPGNNTLPLIISATMHPTDHTSTGGGHLDGREVDMQTKTVKRREKKDTNEQK